MRVDYLRPRRGPRNNIVVARDGRKDVHFPALMLGSVRLNLLSTPNIKKRLSSTLLGIACLMVYSYLLGLSFKVYLLLFLIYSINFKYNLYLNVLPYIYTGGVLGGGVERPPRQVAWD